MAVSLLTGSEVMNAAPQALPNTVGLLAVTNTLTLSDGKTIVNSGNTTGTSIWAAADKGAFFGGTPVVQPVGAGQASTSQTQTSLTDNSGGVASTTLASISDTATKNAVASLAAELALVKTDVANLITLANALRTALVALNAIKGSA